MASTLINPILFENLNTKIEQESSIRQDLGKIVEDLEKSVAYTQGLFSKVHSTPRSAYPAFLAQVDDAIKKEVEAVSKLSAFASEYPYYKYNFKWSNKLQDAIQTVLLSAWLGGLGTEAQPGDMGRLLNLEETGAIFNVPVNLKDRDAFHITIEEYLAALVGVVDELARLAMNSVTLGDFELAVKISSFVKETHAGFQLLNLKNDFLRKRVDGVKYSVKKVEDVIYDLSLRNLLPAQKAANE